ncbi:hypothetical protein EDB80DRAFT_864182 [Ilyonectria destructans]|nr:hypothetical protein EDB80DRAFT_864182 [Ilyonectria destructans]
MSEKMAVNDQPTTDLQHVYKRWAQGGWAALITGNIMVDEKNHPGRQSPLGAGKRGVLSKTLSPSAVPLNIGDNWVACVARAVVFGTPQALARDQVDNVIAQFTRAARLASQAGFDGVEIHAAHEFLLSQFLSSSANKRSDEFGGSVEKRAELINAADYMSEGGFDEMMRQIELIHKENPDYMQLSGGSFEDLRFVRWSSSYSCTHKSDGSKQMLSTRNSVARTGVTAARTIVREGPFLRGSKEVRHKFPQLPLGVTSGVQSQQGVENALARACDAVGLGRPAVKFPDLPDKIMFNGDLADAEARFDVEAAPSQGWIGTKIR